MPYHERLHDFPLGRGMVLEVREDTYGHRQLYATTRGSGYTHEYHPIQLAPPDIRLLIDAMDLVLTTHARSAGPDDPEGFHRRKYAIVHDAHRQLQALENDYDEHHLRTWAEQRVRDLRDEQDAERQQWRDERDRLTAAIEDLRAQIPESAPNAVAEPAPEVPEPAPSAPELDAVAEVHDEDQA